MHKKAMIFSIHKHKIFIGWILLLIYGLICFIRLGKHKHNLQSQHKS